MDPLTVFGLAANVISFVDFAVKVLRVGQQVSRSAQGSTVGNDELEGVTQTLKRLYGGLHLGDARFLKSHENASLLDHQIEEIASACCDIANELLRALDELKYKRAARSFSSVLVALKTVLSESKIRSLRERLSQSQDNLQFALLLSLREEQQKITPELIQSLRSGQAVDQAKADILHEIRQQGKNSQLDHEAFTQLYTILAPLLASLGQAQNDTYLQQKICDQLSFRDQRDRALRIRDAHALTFRWLFESASDAAEACRWSDFPAWLRGDESLYWITGKAGSGKSTLMKYIASQPQCQSELRHWSQDKPLIVTYFYFWNSGSQSQMSQEGLLRSILYQSLQSRPGLASKLFPTRWSRSQLFGLDVLPLGMSELVEAFNHLLSSAKGSFKLCMLVDGLDEFDGDLDDLVLLFKNAVANENVKACLASRPWVVFEEAFQTMPNLRLEDITHPDIVRYTTAEFEDNSGYVALKQHEKQFASGLIQNIALKAQGVFLWVHLVVKSLLSGLSNFDRIADLQRRLDGFPEDLEGFYQKILDSIDPFYATRAYQYFRLIEVARGGLTTARFFYADLEGTESRELVLHLPYGPIAAEDREFQYEAVRRRLNSHCKGLLEVSASASPHLVRSGLEFSDMMVTYLHRTARDFFLKPAVVAQVRAQTQSYDPYTPLLHSYIIVRKSSQDRKSAMGDPALKTLLRFAEKIGKADELEHKVLDVLGQQFCGQGLLDGEFIRPQTEWLITVAEFRLNSYVLWKLRRRDQLRDMICRRYLAVQVIQSYDEHPSFRCPTSASCDLLLPDLEMIKELCGSKADVADASYNSFTTNETPCTFSETQWRSVLTKVLKQIQRVGEFADDRDQLFAFNHWADVVRIFVRAGATCLSPEIREREHRILRIFEDKLPGRAAELRDLIGGNGKRKMAGALRSFRQGFRVRRVTA